nr:MAG TPA: hypothetical protein [Caudoviricetes sp.]
MLLVRYYTSRIQTHKTRPHAALLLLLLIL